MSNCTRCGAYIPVGDTACPACGYDAAKEAERKSGGFSGGAAQARQYSHATEDGSQTSGSYQSRQTQEQEAPQAMTWAPWNREEKGEERQGYRGGSYRNDAGEEERVRRLSVLSYVGPLFLIPLLLCKDSSFARFHANQGLALFLAEIVVKLVLGGPLWLAGVGFCLYCLVLGAKAAAAGRCVELPLIGKMRLLK